MRRFIRKFFGSIVAGLSVSLASLMAIVTQMQQDSNTANLADISGLTWVIVIGSGVGVFLKNMQALLAEPPK